MYNKTKFLTADFSDLEKVINSFLDAADKGYKGFTSTNVYHNIPIRIKEKDGVTRVYVELAGWSKEDLKLEYSSVDGGFNLIGKVSPERKDLVSIKEFNKIIKWNKPFEDTLINTKMENGLFELSLKVKEKEKNVKEIKIN